MQGCTLKLPRVSHLFPGQGQAVNRFEYCRSCPQSSAEHHGNLPTCLLRFPWDERGVPSRLGFLAGHFLMQRRSRLYRAAETEFVTTGNSSNPFFRPANPTRRKLCSRVVSGQNLAWRERRLSGTSLSALGKRSTRLAANVYIHIQYTIHRQRNASSERHARARFHGTSPQWPPETMPLATETSQPACSVLPSDAGQSSRREDTVTCPPNTGMDYFAYCKETAVHHGGTRARISLAL